MTEKIHIEDPCAEEWNKMNPNETGRHCSVCATTVVDFSNRSLEEIQSYLAQHRHVKVCGRYHERHTTQAADKWFNFLNGMESFFIRLKLRRIGIACIAILLFITGCHHRRLSGAYAMFDKKDKKHQRTVVKTSVRASNPVTIK